MSNIFEKRDTIIGEWVRNFIATSGLEPDEYDVGFDGGETPDGIKIIFDGYQENDDGSYNTDSLSFAVFIHRDSINGEFPEHDSQWGLILHRPEEEMHFYAWYDFNEDFIDVIPECEFAMTNMDEEEAQQLFFSVIEKLGLSD